MNLLFKNERKLNSSYLLELYQDNEKLKNVNLITCTTRCHENDIEA